MTARNGKPPQGVGSRGWGSEIAVERVGVQDNADEESTRSTSLAARITMARRRGCCGPSHTSHVPGPTPTEVSRQSKEKTTNVANLYATCAGPKASRRVAEPTR